MSAWESASTLVSAGAAVGSLAVAAAAWRVAVQGRETARLVAGIEQDRVHHEMTPVFEVDAESFRVSAYDDRPRRSLLALTFVGPVTLENVEVELEVRDDRAHRRPSPGDGPTAEEIEQTVWGPYRFEPRVDGTPPDGRRTVARLLAAGEETRFWMEMTPAPRWALEESWRPDVDSRPLRVWVHARHPRYHRGWVVPIEVLPGQRPG